MARALALAERGLYTTTPNPRVGCVIVADGVVIGEGWHERAGAPHAEANALADAAARGRDPRGATMYVTLEPCNHQGRTPPCTDAVIAAGIGRVVVAMADPNPQAANGAARLRAAGIAVDVGLLEDEARELNIGFVSRMTRGRPWVRMKAAASLDGRTALAVGRVAVDHGRGRAGRRPPVARARVRDPHRHRHGPAGRSAAHGARDRHAAAAAPHRHRPPRADAAGRQGARRRRRADRHRGRAQSAVAARHRGAAAARCQPARRPRGTDARARRARHQRGARRGGRQAQRRAARRGGWWTSCCSISRRASSATPRAASPSLHRGSPVFPIASRCRCTM